MSNTFELHQSPDRKGHHYRNRVHRNSVEKVGMSVEKPPELPSQNPKQTQLNQMAGYLNRLDSRLSQPKLHSKVRMSFTNMDGSLRNSGSQPNSPSPMKATTVKRRHEKMNESFERQDSKASIFERRNNSMVELYNSCHQKIQKPNQQMRNSVVM